MAVLNPCERSVIGSGGGASARGGVEPVRAERNHLSLNLGKVQLRILLIPSPTIHNQARLGGLSERLKRPIKKELEMSEQTKETTLYSRLGGYDAIAAVA